MLNRDLIFQAQDLKTVDVDMPEWGGAVRLRMLTASERFAVHEVSRVDGKYNYAVFQAALIEKSAINEDGTPAFVEGDRAGIGAKSAVAVARLADAAESLNGLNPGATDAAEKNS